MKTAVLTNDPVEQIVSLLKDAEAEAALGAKARENLHTQSAAGHSAEAWMYEDLAEACEEATTKLVDEAAAIYKVLDVPLQRRADELVCGCRYASCLH